MALHLLVTFVIIISWVTNSQTKEFMRELELCLGWFFWIVALTKAVIIEWDIMYFLIWKKKKKKFILETSDLKESFLQKGSTKCSVRMISSYFKSQTEEIPMLSSFYLFILYLYFFAGITQRSLLSAGDRKICQQGSTKCSVRKRGFVLG